MKKKLLVFAGIALFLFLGGLSVYISSRDNITNKDNGYDNISRSVSELQMVNWQSTGSGFVSDADPMIILENVNSYIHSVKIGGKWDNDEPVALFYTNSPDEDFSEDKKLVLPYNQIGGCIYFYPDAEICSLRIDLTEEAGKELTISEIEINDRSLLISFSNFMTICVFPVMIYGVLAVILIYMGSIKVYGGVFHKYIPLLKNLIERDLKVKYRRSVLGFLWSILNPLLMALVITIVFSKIFRFQVEYFTVYYLAGSLIFNFVTEATTGSMTSVLGAAPLIKKVYIPKYIFPMQKCMFAFVNMLFASVAVLAVILIQGMPMHLTALLFFVPMLYAFIFAFGLGLILASLTIFFRDIEHLYSVFVSVWMYLTPIIYPEDILPQAVKSIMRFNPMYHYVGYFREVIMYGTVPSMAENMICVSFSLLFLGAGLVFFKKTQDRFILYI